MALLVKGRFQQRKLVAAYTLSMPYCRYRRISFGATSALYPTCTVRWTRTDLTTIVCGGGWHDPPVLSGGNIHHRQGTRRGPSDATRFGIDLDIPWNWVQAAQDTSFWPRIGPSRHFVSSA